MVLICESDLADSHAICEINFSSPQLDPSLSLEAVTIYANEEIGAFKP